MDVNFELTRSVQPIRPVRLALKPDFSVPCPSGPKHRLRHEEDDCRFVVLAGRHCARYRRYRDRIPAMYSAKANISCSRIRPAMAFICAFLRSPEAKFFNAASV
jgi:hypothetical protein